VIRLVFIYASALGLLILSVTGCGRDRSQQVAREATNISTTPTATYTPVAYATPGPSPTPTPTPAPPVNFALPQLPPLPYSDFTPIFSVSTTGAYNGQVDANWCGRYGENLNVTQAAARLAWAKRCYPGWNQWYQIAESVTTGVYPSFGRLNESNLPYNPLNYFGPKADPNSCNLPEGYLLVALCAATR